jgi:hypothetical protein
MKVKELYNEWEVNSFEQNNPNTKIVSITMLKGQTTSLEYQNGQSIPLIRDLVVGYVIVYEELNERT